MCSRPLGWEDRLCPNWYCVPVLWSWPCVFPWDLAKLRSDGKLCACADCLAKALLKKGVAPPPLSMHKLEEQYGPNATPAEMKV